jgi:hypothetical protein
MPTLATRSDEGITPRRIRVSAGLRRVFWANIVLTM